MLAWEIFRKYLFSPRSGSIIRAISRICILSTGIGVFALVVVVSVMNGFNNSIRDKLLTAEPHVVVYAAEGDVRDKAKTYLEGQKKLLEFHPFEGQDIIIRTLDGLFSGAMARGLEPRPLAELLARVQSTRQRKSDAVLSPDLQTETASLGPGEVVMGASLARSLEVFEGEQIIIIAPEALLLPPGEAPPFEKLTVKSLLSTELADIDAHFVYYALGKSLTRLSGSASRESGFEVYLKDPDRHAVHKRALEKTGARVETWVDRNSALFFALKLEKIAMTTFLSLTALITSFCIFTVLILLFNQKQRDIGVLMSMGLSIKAARKTFTKIGLFLSAVGMGTGLLLGTVSSWLLEAFPIHVLPEDVYYDSTIPSRLDLGVWFAIAVGCVIVGALAAWIPVQLNLRQTPSEAIRSGKL